MYASDAFEAYLCKTCGNLAMPPARGTLVRDRSAFCRVCQTSSSVVAVTLPYACKLLVQELQGMHVGVQLLAE